jgi:hypothetical protein
MFVLPAPLVGLKGCSPPALDCQVFVTRAYGGAHVFCLAGFLGDDDSRSGDFSRDAISEERIENSVEPQVLTTRSGFRRSGYRFVRFFVHFLCFFDLLLHLPHVHCIIRKYV